MTLGLIVVAAGSGTRFGGPKQFANLGGKPLLQWCLQAFDNSDHFTRRVVVLREDLIESPQWRAIASALAHPVETVPGGETRALSVRNGIDRLIGECDLVAVHDGARPFPPVDAIRQCVCKLGDDPDLMGVTVAARVTDSLVRINAESGEISRPVDRDTTRRVETPQVSRCSELFSALLLSSAASSTDDMGAIHRAGFRTAVVTHSGFNPKVTTPDDLAILNARLKGAS